MGSHLRSSQQQNDQSSTTSPPELSQDGFQQQYGNAAMQQALASGSPNAAGGPPRPDAPKSKAAALARHSRNRDRVDRMIRSGLAQEAAPAAGAQKSRVNLLRNTCQWIHEREADLYVLTPTHDAHLRPSVSAGQTAYFDTRLKYDQDGADYDATLDAAGQATNDAGLEIEHSSTVGSMNPDGRTMTLIDPISRSEGDLVATFVHEVQHDADQSTKGQPWEVPQPAADPAARYRAPTSAYSSYQSEFRAYWMMNPEGSGADSLGNSTSTAVTNRQITVRLSGADNQPMTTDDTFFTVSTALTNRRQQTIFNHLIRAQPNNIYVDNAGEFTYPYAHLALYYVFDPAFKKMVDAYTQPEGGNLINSPRIQALSAALEKGRFSTEAQALEDQDRQYLQDRSRSKPFWDQASRSLGILQLTILKNIINQPAAAGSTPHTIKVVSGDTLSAIADRYLNKAERHGDIYLMNRKKIGADPNSLRVGMELELPPL